MRCSIGRAAVELAYRLRGIGHSDDGSFHANEHLPYIFESTVAIFVIITLVKTFLSSSIGLNMTLTNDLVANPKNAGTAFGLLLLGGNLFGAFAPVVTGHLVKVTGNYGSAFLLAGVLIIVGAVISFFMARRPIVVD